jgi:hypothetical protein
MIDYNLVEQVDSDGLSTFTNREKVLRSICESFYGVEINHKAKDELSVRCKLSYIYFMKGAGFPSSAIAKLIGYTSKSLVCRKWKQMNDEPIIFSDTLSLMDDINQIKETYGYFS